MAPASEYASVDEEGLVQPQPRAADFVKELQEEIDSSLLNILGRTEEDFDQLEAMGESEDVLYCVKWADLAHIKNTWHPLTDLEQMEKDGEIKGVRKVLNYKRVADERDAVLYDPKTSSEHKEVINCEVRVGEEE